MFVVWLFKFTLSWQEETAGVDEQYKKTEFPCCSSDLSHAEANRRLKERELFHLVECFGNSPFIFLETQNNPQEELCRSTNMMVLGQTHSCIEI